MCSYKTATWKEFDKLNNIVVLAEKFEDRKSVGNDFICKFMNHYQDTDINAQSRSGLSFVHRGFWQVWQMQKQYASAGKLRTLKQLIASIAIFALIFTTPIMAGDLSPIPTIKVSATGSAQLAPDMAILNLIVMREDKTARMALAANNGAMNDVIEELKQTGIKPKDLQTANFSIQALYRNRKSTSNNENQPRIIAYRVSNSLTVRISDLKSLGAILDKVVTLGVNSGGNVHFTNQDPVKAIDLARTRAMKNAIAKAQTLTRAAGVKLGEILLISEGVQNNHPIPLAQAQASYRSASKEFVPLEAGENNYEITVEVNWKILQ